MNTVIFFDFSVDKEKKTISFQREFAASPGFVWDAWTKSELLDRWWASKPYKAKTKSMDFKVGGSWLYDMITPEHVSIPSQFDFKEIEYQKRFSAEGWSGTQWTYTFNGNGATTLVKAVIHFAELSDMEGMVAMGFREGLITALGQLDEVLKG